MITTSYHFDLNSSVYREASMHLDLNRTALNTRLFQFWDKTSTLVRCTFCFKIMHTRFWSCHSALYPWWQLLLPLPELLTRVIPCTAYQITESYLASHLWVCDITETSEGSWEWGWVRAILKGIPKRCLRGMAFSRTCPLSFFEDQYWCIK